MTTLEILWVLTFPVAVVLFLALLGGRSRALALAGALVAAAGLAGDAGKARQQRSVTRFVPVEAEVVVSERGRRRNDWTFAYAYHVGGEPYRASRLTHAPRLRSRGDTDHLAERFPVGRRFTAYVDPADPSRAVVDRDPSYALPLAGLVIHGGLLAAVRRTWVRAG